MEMTTIREATNRVVNKPPPLFPFFTKSSRSYERYDSIIAAWATCFV
jgi:hypothetical protein